LHHITVNLKHSTPLELGEWAASFPYANESREGRFERIVTTYKHLSEAEFLEYWFGIYGISRLCLQELARHRIGVSYSVQSTRYTIKKAVEAWRAGKPLIDFYVMAPDKEIAADQLEIVTSFLERADRYLAMGKKQDTIKYLLPECWRVNLAFKLNARSLLNLISLRHANNAHFEIRRLARLFLEAVPDDQRFLYRDAYTAIRTNAVHTDHHLHTMEIEGGLTRLVY
jgi:thymidylate synthase (FAD)